jgi:hypothetical protein
VLRLNGLTTNLGTDARIGSSNARASGTGFHTVAEQAVIAAAASQTEVARALRVADASIAGNAFAGSGARQSAGRKSAGVRGATIAVVAIDDE